GKAMKILDAHHELRLNRSFVKEAALLHDIGIFQTDAPGIQCFGENPYIAHGYLGAEILRAEGFPQHALVCERHTGAGLSLQEIIDRQLPIPHREMLPVTMEEQLICFADKFFSKTRLDEEKTVEKARQSIAKYGEEGLSRFDRWCSLFL
ncbi:HDIG domain-containing metalloprotein, partial [Bacteroides congonensis]